MPAKQWDQFTSFVNAYYAVQEHLEEVRGTGGSVGTGLSSFCHDANPFLWDAPGSADPSVYGNFRSAFSSRFSSTQSTAAEALAFCRDWLRDYGGDRYQNELLDAFDSVVDSPQTWESAYAPINDQLELRARINEMSPQDDPADHASQAATAEQGTGNAATDKPASGAPGKAEAPEPESPAPSQPGTETAPRSQPHAPANVLVHDWGTAKKTPAAEAASPVPGQAATQTSQPTHTSQEETTVELVAPGAPQEVCKATLSDTDAIASLLAMDDPLLARSLEEFIMRGMQCGTVVELVVRESDEVVACGGLTFVELMPTPQNPSGVYGVVSGLAAKQGHADDLQLLLEAIEKKSLARGVGELMLLDGSAVSVQACEKYGYRLEGSRILMRL